MLRACVGAGAVGGEKADGVSLVFIGAAAGGGGVCRGLIVFQTGLCAGGRDDGRVLLDELWQPAGVYSPVLVGQGVAAPGRVLEAGGHGGDYLFWNPDHLCGDPGGGRVAGDAPDGNQGGFYRPAGGFPGGHPASAGHVGRGFADHGGHSGAGVAGLEKRAGECGGGGALPAEFGQLRDGGCADRPLGSWVWTAGFSGDDFWPDRAALAGDGPLAGAERLPGARAGPAPSGAGGGADERSNRGHGALHRGVQ